MPSQGVYCELRRVHICHPCARYEVLPMWVDVQHICHPCARYEVLPMWVDVHLALRALNAAVRARGKVDGMLHHSDRGCTYASDPYRDRLDALGMRASMSRAGDCWDNAVAESFFSTLEAELLCRNRFHSHAQACGAVSEYIDQFFNPQRRHSTIGYISPIAFELRWQSRQIAV